MKRTSLKRIISMLIILSMIISSFVNVKRAEAAEITGPTEQNIAETTKSTETITSEITENTEKAITKVPESKKDVNAENEKKTSEVTDETFTKAFNWLKKNQNKDGSWGNTDVSYLDTIQVSEHLKKNNLLVENLQKSEEWMNQVELLNNDAASRILPFLDDKEKYAVTKDKILKSQNKNGGWGIGKGYDSDLLDTILSLNALIADGNTETSVLKKAVSFIIRRQNSNGSWSLSNKEDSTVSLTAQTAITLNAFQINTGLTSSELETSMKKAGEFLIAVQKKNKPLENDADSMADTLLSYNAVLHTVGMDAGDTVNAVDESVRKVQDSDGSWCGSPYITALALDTMRMCASMPTAKIDSIELIKNIDGKQIECEKFNAYDTFEIQVDSTSSNVETNLLYFIKQKDRSIVSAQTDGKPGWNTKNNAPGDYSVIVQIKDNTSGKILATKEKPFEICPHFEVTDVVLTTDPENTRITDECNVNVETTLITCSNIEKNVVLKTSVFYEDTVIKEETKTLECNLTNGISKCSTITFTPDAAASKKYIIKTEVFDGETKLKQGETVFSVLPPLPSTRIDIGQSLNKPVLYPGNDTVSLEWKMNGQGVVDTPQRNSVDLVLAIDDSGSMEYNDLEDTSKKPWRIDFAKEASNHVIDMLQKNDRGAIVEFAGSSWIQQKITEDKALLKTSIAKTPASPWDGTAIGKGLQSANSILKENSSKERNKVILLLSDGGENAWSYSSVVDQADIAKENGYVIYTIGLGAGVDENLLRTLANKTGGKYVYSPTMKQLDEMMTELAGEIFDTAGKNVILETTIPVNGMTVDTAKILPAPTSVRENEDKSVTLTWKLDRLVMGQEKLFKVNYAGKDLISDTEVLLTKDTKLTYLDKNDTTVTEKLPDLKIAVSKYMLDSKVATDKEIYTANENVMITNKVKNMTDYSSTLTGKAEIIDSEGNVVKTIVKTETSIWAAGETKTIDFSWNTGSIMTGSYKVKVSWMEGKKVISVAETGFAIAADAEILSSITVDKQNYTADEAVNISETVKNNSTNHIHKDLTVKTSITNSKGEISWSLEKELPELLPTKQNVIKENWNTEKNAPGKYTVTMEVYKGEKKLSKAGTEFEIVSVSETEGIMDISGSLEVLPHKIFSRDDVTFQYAVNNTGNKRLDNVTARIRIVDTATGAAIDTVTDNTDLEVSESYTGEIVWSHEALKTGNYLVILDGVMPDGREVALASKYFTVEKPEILKSEAFQYTIFAGSTQDPLCMYLYHGTINGDIRTNHAFQFSGTKLAVNGLLSSLGAINAWGSDIQIPQKKTDAQEIEMPDAVSEIKQIASVNGHNRSSSLLLSDYGSGIKLTESEINEDSIQMDGSTLESSGYIVAENNVSFNVSNLRSTAEEGIVICSSNGDITIHANTAELKGIIYAPNGTVYINSKDFKLAGRIIAKKVVVNCSEFTVTSSEKDLNLLDVSCIR